MILGLVKAGPDQKPKWYWISERERLSPIFDSLQEALDWLEPNDASKLQALLDKLEE